MRPALTDIAIRKAHPPATGQATEKVTTTDSTTPNQKPKPKK